MISRAFLCNIVTPSLTGIRRHLLDAAEVVGRMEVAVSTCHKPSPPLVVEAGIFTFSTPPVIPRIISNATIAVTSHIELAAPIQILLPPPPPPIPAPSRTILGPIFQITPYPPSSPATPHPAYLWIAEKVEILTERVDSFWNHRALLSLKSGLRMMAERMDGFSDYYFPIVLGLLTVMATYSICTVVRRIQRERAGFADEAKVDTEVPSNPPKCRLHSLGTILVSTLRALVSSVPFRVILLAFYKVVEAIIANDEEMIDFNLDDKLIWIHRNYFAWLRQVSYGLSDYFLALWRAGAQFIGSTWNDGCVTMLRTCSSWVSKGVDDVSEYLLVLVLGCLGCMLLSTIYIMISRIKRASTCGEDDAKVIIVGPNDSLKCRLRSFGTLLASSLGRTIFPVIHKVTRLTCAVVHVIQRVKLALEGVTTSIVCFFKSFVPRRAAPPPPPATVSAPVEVTPPVSEVTSLAAETSTPVSSPSPSSPSPLQANPVDLAKLQSKYGSTKNVAGSRRVQGTKKKVTVLHKLD
ncbi:hypothetical protein FRC03_000889 [Tulasnella sp. 419]|nr:hypothetical protein FRC03_000889 [Tulasnella sp. 419]